MSTLTKISALLAMAERTENQHEAEAFLAKAQQLATLASVDLAMARAATDRREARQQPMTKTIQIGELRSRVNRHLIALFIGLAHANDCQLDVAHNSTYVIAYGMPSDIEVTEVLFNSLATQMVAMGTAWVRRGEWKGDTYLAYQQDRRGRRVPIRKNHTALTARGAFYAGFTSSISQRVQQARDEAVAQRTAEAAQDEAAVISTAVVLRDKEKEIKDYHRKQSQARGTWAGYSGAGARGGGGAATAAGREAGKRAHIGRQSGISGGPGRLTS